MKEERSGTPDRLRQTLSNLMRQLWRGLRSSREQDRAPTYDAPMSDAPRRPSAQVIDLRERRGAPSKDTEPSGGPLTEEPGEEGAHKQIDELRRKVMGYGLVAAATAGILVSGGYWWWFETRPADPGPTVHAATGKTRSYTMHGGVVASLKARAMLRVDGRDQHEHAHLVEGEATFDVPALDEPFEVSTYLATARTSVPSKFTVVVSMGVEFKVHTGEIAIAPVGAKEYVINLKPGQTYRLLDGLAGDRARTDRRATATGNSAQDGL